MACTHPQRSGWGRHTPSTHTQRTHSAHSHTHTHAHTRTHTHMADSAVVAPASRDASAAVLAGREIDPPARAATPAGSGFQDFFAHACRAGLTIVRQCHDASLLPYAEQALVLEQKLATGCFLLQAVLLVEHCMRAMPPCGSTNMATVERDKQQRAQDFGKGGDVRRMLASGRWGACIFHLSFRYACPVLCACSPLLLPAALQYSIHPALFPQQGGAELAGALCRRSACGSLSARLPTGQSTARSA